MTEIIITKRCSKCKQIKPLSEFFKNRSQHDGLGRQCKMCDKARLRAYTKTVAGKKVYRAATEKYRQTEKGKEVYRKACEKYDQSEQRKENLKEYALRNPQAVQAKWDVNNAIATGRLPKASTKICTDCGQPAHDYHHHLGYETKHRFDIIPLCRSCHYKRHNLL